jgi:hypothetical protein
MMIGKQKTCDREKQNMEANTRQKRSLMLFHCFKGKWEKEQYTEILMTDETRGI